MRPIACRVIRTVLPSLLVIFALGMPAKGQLFLITSRPLVSGNDFINWTNAGPPFTFTANPFNINSFNGNTTTVSAPGGTLIRFDQGNPWNGNFAPGDALLDSDQPLSLTFTTPLFAVGAQFQSDFYSPFTARIEAFDASNNSLGFFFENGISNNKADNSAVFIGVGSSTQNIKKISFTLAAVGGPPNDFAINRVEMNSASAVIPEGSSLAMLAAGGLPILLIVRRRFRVNWGS
jgi:hypothetical protein